ncbi:unnamed protein product [Phyllotreta striolata]|uniref:Single domain-containing protein n=1 Tax=Phyllotreta striolata TaxID=444603 RepID=A0A9N9TDB3_PHYSR|nr:unnamed protein product [Phyllotreta striolata]
MFKLLFLTLCVLVAYSNAESVTECKLTSGQVVKVGEEVPEIGTCNIVTCHKDGSISALTCPAFKVAPPCYTKKGDPTKLYPDCCDSPKCP